MGTLRLLLAFAVVIGHSAPIPGLPLLGAGLAVKVFFVVSGLYMALILSEKYEAQPHGRWLFYSNRFLRIFPLYWVVLGLDMLVGGVWPEAATNAMARGLHGETLQTSLNAMPAHGAGWFGMAQFSESVWFPLSAIGLSVALAWLLVIGLDKPMEQWRQRRVHLSARGE